MTSFGGEEVPLCATSLVHAGGCFNTSRAALSGEQFFCTASVQSTPSYTGWTAEVSNHMLAEYAVDPCLHHATEVAGVQTLRNAKETAGSHHGKQTPMAKAALVDECPLHRYARGCCCTGSASLCTLG